MKLAQLTRRKLDDAQAEESSALERTRRRIEHLNQASTFTGTEQPDYYRWQRIRLDRMLVDYFLRRGMTDTAAIHVRDTGIQVRAATVSSRHR